MAPFRAPSKGAEANRNWRPPASGADAPDMADTIGKRLI